MSHNNLGNTALSFTICKPDDMHVHLRDGVYLQHTVPDVARHFARAIVMPNLKPPVTTLAQMEEYRQRILAAVPAGIYFQPLMTLYLTDDMSPALLQQASKQRTIAAVKLYPAGATTNSQAGVTNLQQLYPVFETMQRENIPLLIHGEINDASVDIFDREKVFLGTLATLIKQFPELRIVLEHITTRDAVQFVTAASDNVAATITVHHLLLNRNHLLAGGIRPHYYCLPVLKRHEDQQALLAAATSGNKKFFLGTDSAPHAQSTKENACGCAGIYSAHAAIELYAQVFDSVGCLDKLEAFASHHGADFYRLPRNAATITLQKKPWRVAETLPFGNETLVPLLAGEEIAWSLT